MGVIHRETQDCDILSPEIPSEIKKLSEEFAKEKKMNREDLSLDWLNNGPKTLGTDLPTGWTERVEVIFSRNALTLRTLGREDLLKSKLFAYCDRATDFGDCIALRPTQDELSYALPWLKKRDATPYWPSHVESELKRLAEKLGHGL